LVLGASDCPRIPAPLFHHQSVLNINIKNIFIYHLKEKENKKKWTGQEKEHTQGCQSMLLLSASSETIRI
jgi:hypothetical protein